MIDAGDVFVSTTVLLESEWVLRSVYGLSRTEVAAALRAFAGLPDLSVENPAVLAEALDCAEKGMDFRGCTASRRRRTMRGTADVRPSLHRTGRRHACQGDGTMRYGGHSPAWQGALTSPGGRPMHVSAGWTIENIRSIRQLDIDLRGEESSAGWHVLLGDNGAGKSTVVRALALALMGEPDAYATREDWSRWINSGSESGRIVVELGTHERDEWTVGEQVDKVPIRVIASIPAQDRRAKAERTSGANRFFRHLCP